MNRNTITALIIGLSIGITATVCYFAVKTVLGMQAQLNDASMKANASFNFLNEQVNQK